MQPQLSEKQLSAEERRLERILSRPAKVYNIPINVCTYNIYTHGIVHVCMLLAIAQLLLYIGLPQKEPEPAYLVLPDPLLPN